MFSLAQRKRSNRPWGSFEQFTENEQTTIKLITVHAHEALSLQTHENRVEFWRIIAGSGIATVGTQEIPVTANDEVVIEANTAHRMTAGDTNVVFLEIAFGDFDENDITRLEDNYGRA